MVRVSIYSKLFEFDWPLLASLSVLLQTCHAFPAYATQISFSDQASHSEVL